MQEMVVLVRDAVFGWVSMTSAMLKEMGCAVGLIGGPLTAQERAELNGLVDEVAVFEGPPDAHRIADLALELSRGYRLGALLSMVDSRVTVAAQAAELAGVGRVPAVGLARARNKYAARCAMRDAGLPGPEFALLCDPAQAADVAERVGLPAVIKPVNGTGSHLVEPVATVAELAQAYRRLAGRLLDAPHLRDLYTHALPGGLDPKTSFLVESRLRGREFCLDVIVRDGQVEHLPLVDKFLIDDRFFELGFVSPPLDLAEDLAKRIAECVDDAVRVLGLDNTVACIEVIDDETAGPTIVEVNAGRPAGQLITVVYQLATGVNTAAELISLARGVPSPRGKPSITVPLATFTLFPGGTGRLRAIDGLDALADLPDVLRVVPIVKPGDLISDDFEIWAVNLLVAALSSYEELAELYEQARALVSFDLEPVAPVSG